MVSNFLEIFIFKFRQILTLFRYTDIIDLEVFILGINRIIEEKGITKYRLAKESGVPHATLNDICSGKTNIGKCSAETLYKISKVLNVSMESLLSDDSYEGGFKRELEEEKER